MKQTYGSMLIILDLECTPHTHTLEMDDTSVADAGQDFEHGWASHVT